MIEFFLAFVVMVLVVAGMAIGVISGRPPIAGSCGGLNNLGIDGACEICGGDPNRCEEENSSTVSNKSSYENAMK
ncbi:MAG: (Na+)-NQR maturation NqrM [Gammaproteobacteria bacterium]|jgi:uncharacterized protein|nr:(Na+)-NQR maturation NqrM [Gammaproteobacteria bacterium]MBT4492059.1 (Na+)-NQR maturation NqrM [Gammaproteobacteria bacterium]MBT7371232.1 (Na+)-NQR maturation NqrM [Gammaproteobacteria bacterium]